VFLSLQRAPSCCTFCLHTVVECQDLNEFIDFAVSCAFIGKVALLLPVFCRSEHYETIAHRNDGSFSAVDQYERLTPNAANRHDSQSAII